jgi:UDP:flavonoid glycosyltransferase YjiC (YdhE family)
MGHDSQRDELSIRGFEVVGYRHGLRWSGRTPRSRTRAAIDFLRLICDRGFGVDLTDVVTRIRPDRIVIDAMIPCAGPAARRCGVPYAMLMHTVSGFFTRIPLIEWAGRSAGFSPRRQWARAPATIVVTDRALDRGSGTAPPNYVWAGAAEQPPLPDARTPDGVKPDDRESSRRRVLISVSSVHIEGQAAVLQRILDAVGGIDVDAITTTGPTIAPDSLHPPPNTKMLQGAPHLELMPSCSAMVGHGGHSSTIRALMHDLPVLVIPADDRIDQPMVGRAVAELGAGLCLHRDSDVLTIRAKIERLVTDATLRSGASVIGDRLRATDGALEAARIVEQLDDRTA